MKSKYLLIVIGLVCSVCNADRLVRIPKGFEERLWKLGMKFHPDHFSNPHFQVGYVEDLAILRLPARMQANLLFLDEKIWALGGYDRETFRRLDVDLSDPYVGYHDYSALTEWLNVMKSRYPEFIRVQSAGKSVQGRELWYLILSDKVNEEEGEPKFIYHANMHGDEVVGRELMLTMVEYLMEQYGKEPKITQLVDHSQIFIMPSMNPDGFEMGIRNNARGKDLNRNFPDRFNSPSDTPNGREVEVQHMMNLAAANHFVYGINWHGGEICFNLPWGNISNGRDENKFGDDDFFYPIGREYTEHNPSMYANHHRNFDHGLTYGYEWYPVNGGINDWLNYFRRSVHSVIEVSVTKWPSAFELPRFWNENKEAMITYLWRGLRGIHLKVVNGSGNLVTRPMITVSSLPKRSLAFDSGYIHRLTGEGNHRITVSASGYQPQTFEVAASYFDGNFTQLTLVP